MVSDKIFSNVFPIISLCKTCDRWGGAIFGLIGHNLNKLDRGPLGDVYQLSKL